MKILITAGPTREYLDPVRYLSNDSSGEMGFALAKGARELDHEVVLIAGPVSLATPDGVERIDVISAEEMYEACLQEAPAADLIFMAAAVADWRPRERWREKIKKESLPLNEQAIPLAQNPDILLEICRRRQPHQIIVGFALETSNLIEAAREKLKKKGCDWIVANDASAIGRPASEAFLLHRQGFQLHLPQASKEDLAKNILATFSTRSTTTP